MVNSIKRLERFYTKRGGKIRYYRGYLSDPNRFGSFIQPDVVSLDGLKDKNCVILLGPQNFGKTQDAKRTYNSICIEHPLQCIWTDLAECFSQKDIEDTIFSNPIFVDCIGQGKDIFLFLDHWEMGVANFGNKFSGQFLKQLERYRENLNKIYIRIICRNSEWLKIIETKLENLFLNVGVYEIAPLRELDVEFLAIEAGVSDTNSFLEQIRELQLTQLATRPDTLEVLINYYQTGQKEAKELFEKCCLLLCEEDVLGNYSFLTTRFSSAIERLEIAKRIAAFTLLCNKSDIFTQINRGQLVNSDILVSELMGSYEEIQGTEVIVDETIIRETLRTGLFETSSEERVRWVNPIYQNYLAAKYIVSRNIDDKQILNLITEDHPIKKEKRFSPIFYGVAGWLAILKDKLFEKVTDIDPSVILRSKVQVPEGDIRVTLFTKLLKALEKDIWSFQDLNVTAWYGQLEYSGLNENLKLIISDIQAPFSHKFMAVDTAVACEYKSLRETIYKLVFNSNENTSLRIRGFHAIKDYYQDDENLMTIYEK